MNVKGFSSDDKITDLRVAAQNESLLALSTRLSDAMNKFPSEESEELLLSIMNDAPDNELGKVLKFQCQRGIAKYKIKCEQYEEAIPYLIESLKNDEKRTDIWAQLAFCAQKTQNLNLFRAANSRITEIRPQINIEMNESPMPSLLLKNDEPKFIGYNLAEPCWRLFLRTVEDAIKTNPNDIPEFVIPSQIKLKKRNNPKLLKPKHIKHQSVPKISKQQMIKSLCGYSLNDFFGEFVAREVNDSTWLFSEPMILFAATVVNKIAKLPFTSDICPKDISKCLINISLNPIIFNELTPATKLFLAELTLIYCEDKCSIFLKDVNPPNLHSQNALLRIAFATLEHSIGLNLPYDIIEVQLKACRLNLDKELCLAHTGTIINQQLLDEKEKQIQILKMIETRKLLDNVENLFAESQLLSFLTLSNIISLFTIFDEKTQDSIFSLFLKLLPDLILKNRKEIDNLSKIFVLINKEMDEESTQQLQQIFKTLSDIGANPELIFHSALALAIASKNTKETATQLSKIHKQLGKLCVCHLHNGRFLECLLDVLIPRYDEFENELTSAFTCYFSDMPLCNVNHHSQLQFKCSPYVQPYIDHAYRLDTKGSTSLFGPYLGIWKHWKSGCNCVKSIDGWRMYKIIKKKENLLYKMELPNNFTPQIVLEDLLRNDHEHLGESQSALAKVLLRSYLSTTEPSMEKLDEAIKLLESDNSNLPQLQLMKAISYALKNIDPIKTVHLLMNLPKFEKPKKEARRLYWIMRLSLQINQPQDAVNFANEALELVQALPTDFAIPLLCYSSEITGNKKILENCISNYCKTRIVSPCPLIILAKQSEPKKAFELISKLVRTQSVNINMFFHFDYKPPFLMERHDDITNIRHDVLQIFIDSSCASGNFTELFGLFNPSRKLDHKASKVLTRNRTIYGIDRLDIYERYVRELSKICKDKSNLKKAIIERALDALIRGTQIECTDGLLDALEELLSVMWKNETGNEPTEETTVQDLINMINGVDDDDEIDEEEDEEEDGNFVESDEEIDDDNELETDDF